MIRKHIDIIAILLLLGGFAVAAQSRQVAVRLVRTRLEVCKRPRPLQVRIGPFQFNANKLHKHVESASRLI
jgi:hypothetical protein